MAYCACEEIKRAPRGLCAPLRARATLKGISAIGGMDLSRPLWPRSHLGLRWFQLKCRSGQSHAAISKLTDKDVARYRGRDVSNPPSQLEEVTHPEIFAEQEFGFRQRRFRNGLIAI